MFVNENITRNITVQTMLPAFKTKRPIPFNRMPVLLRYILFEYIYYSNCRNNNPHIHNTRKKLLNVLMAKYE